eukprot:1323821-Amorphochlora_amoeboformis.AAC.1
MAAGVGWGVLLVLDHGHVLIMTIYNVRTSVAGRIRRDLLDLERLYQSFKPTALALTSHIRFAAA